MALVKGPLVIRVINIKIFMSGSIRELLIWRMAKIAGYHLDNARRDSIPWKNQAILPTSIAGLIINKIPQKLIIVPIRIFMELAKLTTNVIALSAECQEDRASMFCGKVKYSDVLAVCITLILKPDFSNQ